MADNLHRLGATDQQNAGLTPAQILRADLAELSSVANQEQEAAQRLDG